MTSYLVIEKDGNVELSQCFKTSEVDRIHFTCQVCSLMKTRARIHFLVLGPGSGISEMQGDVTKFKANRLYEIVYTVEKDETWQNGVYKVIVALEFQQNASSVGGKEEMTFRIY